MKALTLTFIKNNIICTGDTIVKAILNDPNPDPFDLFENYEHTEQEQQDIKEWIHITPELAIALEQRKEALFSSSKGLDIFRIIFMIC